MSSDSTAATALHLTILTRQMAPATQRHRGRLQLDLARRTLEAVSASWLGADNCPLRNRGAVKAEEMKLVVNPKNIGFAITG